MPSKVRGVLEYSTSFPVLKTTCSFPAAEKAYIDPFKVDHSPWTPVGNASILIRERNRSRETTARDMKLEEARLSMEKINLLTK